MEFQNFINLIFLFVVNISFFFLGICLNSLVIISFWRSAQLRKKLCYFMIMVLSCFDLLAVLTNHSLLAYIALSWLTRDRNPMSVRSVHTVYELSSVFIAFSLLALLVMNFDRYLATYYPIYHRTFVTKGKLLTLLLLLIFFHSVLCLTLLKFVISYHVTLLLFFMIITPLMLFTNYKLFKIAYKYRGRTISPDMRKRFSLKNISSCLLAVASFVALCIPVFVYIALRMCSYGNKYSSDDAHLVGLWARAISSMNGTYNCLIFYWKNPILRSEGMKVIQSLKIFRR